MSEEHELVMSTMDKELCKLADNCDAYRNKIVDQAGEIDDLTRLVAYLRRKATALDEANVNLRVQVHAFRNQVHAAGIAGFDA